MRRGDREQREATPAEGQPRGWRRWIRVGPGLIVALVAAAILLLLQARTRLPEGPPLVERQVAPSTSPRGGTYPEVSFLLERRERLQLTPKQRARLEEIQAEWERETAADRRALVKESRQFQEFLRESQRKGPAPIPEIQRRAAAASALSGAVAAERYQAWQKALSALTPEQRARAEAMRKAEARPWRTR